MITRSRPGRSSSGATIIRTLLLILLFLWSASLQTDAAYSEDANEDIEPEDDYSPPQGDQAKHDITSPPPGAVAKDINDLKDPIDSKDNKQTVLKSGASPEEEDDDDGGEDYGEEEKEETKNESKSTPKLRGSSGVDEVNNDENQKRQSLDDDDSTGDDNGEDDDDDDDDLLGSPPRGSTEPLKPSTSAGDDEDDEDIDDDREVASDHHNEQQSSDANNPFRSSSFHQAAIPILDDPAEFVSTIENIVRSIETIKRHDIATRRNAERLLDESIIASTLAVAEETSGCLGHPYVNASTSAITELDRWPKVTVKAFLKRVAGCGEGFPPEYYSLNQEKDCAKLKTMSSSSSKVDVWDVNKDGESDVEMSVAVPMSLVAKCASPSVFVSMSEDDSEDHVPRLVRGFVVSGPNKLSGFWDVRGDDPDRNVLRPVVEIALKSMWNSVVESSPWMKVVFSPVVMGCEMRISVSKKSKAVRFRSIKIAKQDSVKGKLVQYVARQLQKRMIKSLSLAEEMTFSCPDVGVKSDDDCALTRIALAPECTATFPEVCAMSSPPTTATATTTTKTTVESGDTQTMSSLAEKEQGDDDPYAAGDTDSEDDTIGNSSSYTTIESATSGREDVSSLLQRDLVARGGCDPIPLNETSLAIMEPSAELFT